MTQNSVTEEVQIVQRDYDLRLSNGMVNGALVSESARDYSTDAP